MKMNIKNIASLIVVLCFVDSLKSQLVNSDASSQQNEISVNLRNEMYLKPEIKSEYNYRAPAYNKNQVSEDVQVKEAVEKIQQKLTEILNQFTSESETIKINLKNSQKSNSDKLDDLTDKLIKEMSTKSVSLGASSLDKFSSFKSSIGDITILAEQAVDSKYHQTISDLEGRFKKADKKLEARVKYAERRFDASLKENEERFAHKCQDHATDLIKAFSELLIRLQNSIPPLQALIQQAGQQAINSIVTFVNSISINVSTQTQSFGASGSAGSNGGNIATLSGKKSLMTLLEESKLAGREYYISQSDFKDKLKDLGDIKNVQPQNRTI